MRCHPFSLYFVNFLVGFFFFGAADILADPLIYGNNPWNEEEEVSIMEGIAGAGTNTTGDRSASDVTLQSYESSESVESEETMLMGGDYSKMRSAAAYSTSLQKNRANSYFTSPAAVFESAVALTGGVIHHGLAAAEQASRDEAMGAFEQEQAYLTSLAATPDGARFIAAYRNCKEDILKGGGTGSVSTFQAIKHCVGGYDEAPSIAAIGSTGDLFTASAATQVQLKHQDNRPDPIEVQQIARDTNGSFNQVATARVQCELPTSTYNSKPKCYERSLWDYVYHFVKKRPTSVFDSERNPLMWMWSDEKAFYFGNVKYTEYKMSDDATGATLTDEQKNTIKKKREPLAPAKRWVNFWGPNGDSMNLSGVVPSGYRIGTWSPLSGIELIRAPFFQDIYGGLYGLSIKMCEHANAEIDLLKNTQYNGFNPRCELWDAPLDAQWNTENVTVPGLAVTVQGCEISGSGATGPPSPLWNRRIFPEESDTNNVDYEFLWPSRVRLANAAVGGSPGFESSDRVNWQPRRYYENWENISELPKIKSLLQHLELTQHEAMMLRDILLYEIPKDEDGLYQCTEILNGVSYGEIMEFSEEKTATLLNDSEWYIQTHLNYRLPKSSSWPIRSKVRTPGYYGPFLAPEKDKEISKRITLFYNYANQLAKMRALTVVEKHLSSLNGQVNSIRHFPEQMKDAVRLISSQLPGESMGASMTQRTLLRDELITIKGMLKDLHEELKSAARFTDKAGKRGNIAAGAAGKP